MDPSIKRRLPVGAESQLSGGVHFRLWAPRRHRVEVVFQSVSGEVTSTLSLTAEEGGYFSAADATAKVGTRYSFRVDDDPGLFPDPASRFQPLGSRGPSQVVDPGAYRWCDSNWRGKSLKGQVMYELHIGTFTHEGTWAAAAQQLPHLVDLGITLLEVMPVAEFAGQFGWGYDGVQMFAPTRLYGSPDDCRAFVDEAHRLGLGVLLDVVYNHFGPVDNYTGVFSNDYVSRRHTTEWGDALNFDGANAGPVREYFIANAGYWIDEFHFDGLRLDATHAILDDSPESILTAVGRRVREAAAGRDTIVVAENEFQDARLLQSCDQGGCGLDAMWTDDFHHSARVAMTGHNEYYYGDYLGTPQELVSALKWGFLYQGQWNARQGHARGTPAWRLPAEQFVIFLQNHDQVANSGNGLRAQFLTSPGRYRALTAALLLAPQTPMLFQGQEFAASSPFLYFADHEVEIAALVRQGREESLRQFRSMAGPDFEGHFADPSAAATFERSKLDHSEREKHREAYQLHRDLLALRKSDPVFSAQRGETLEGAVLGDEALILRYLTENENDRLLLINLGRDLAVTPASEPLLAPPLGKQWDLLWSSEDPRYGGSGTGVLDVRNWHLPGHATIVLRPAAKTDN